MSNPNQQSDYGLQRPIHKPFGDLEGPKQDSGASYFPRNVRLNLNEEGDDIVSPPRRVGSGIFRRILSFMAGNPLLARSFPSQGQASYGLVPSYNSIDEVLQTSVTSQGNRKQGKSSSVGSSGSAGISRSERHRVGEGKRSNEEGLNSQGTNRSQRERRPGGHSMKASDDESDTHEDEAIDIDEAGPRWADENPPDNSPGKPFFFENLFPFLAILSLVVLQISRSMPGGLITLWKGILAHFVYRFSQVRASVSAIDDTSLSISTPRMWTLTLICALFGSSSNLFFSLRYPSVFISPVIALVIVHPLGRAWDKMLKYDDDPVEAFDFGIREEPKDYGSRKRRLRLWLAQGKWNEKEHACVYVGSNVSFGFAFATDVIVEQTKFYHQELSIMYQILLIISSQILGYAFAGMTRRYLVRPPGMIWPGTLMSTAMFTTMHKSENKIANGWAISRWKFFLVVWFGACAWYFVPGLLMPSLSYFNVLTWFAPNNVVVANLFGVVSGLGLFPMTFDWAQIAYIGSPLLTPWWAAANVVGGLVIVMWIVAPIMYYNNVLYSAFMPILSSAVFDDTGKPYDVSRILTKSFHFDRKAYENYSKVYLPITYALSYGVQFAGLSALITHTLVWHGRDLWQQTAKSFSEDKDHETEYYPINAGIGQGGNNTEGSRSFNSHSNTQSMLSSLMDGKDVHNRLMKHYDDAPLSWYLTTFVAMLAIAIFVVEYYPVYLPWYGLLLALAITALLFIPIGIVMAITNQQSSLYLICQLICGAIFPGRPVANMVFVTYCYITSTQGLKFSSDLKLGHYMKIPPRILFKVQMMATLVASFTQIGVLNWMFTHIPSLCTPEAINGFICPIARVHFNGSILWGVVGPQRFFGTGALYRPLVWAFLIGALAPILIWLVGRQSGANSLWRKINLPVVFGSLSFIPPATGLNFSVWAVVCFSFNYLLRRRAPAWWGKYTMTLSAALDSGLAFAVVVIFFAFIYSGWMSGFTWWGTEIYKEGCDWHICPYKTLQPGQHFGT